MPEFVQRDGLNFRIPSFWVFLDRPKYVRVAPAGTGVVNDIKAVRNAFPTIQVKLSTAARLIWTLLNAFDIEPFLFALFDPEEYEAQLPVCHMIHADINGDGDINALDSEGFLGLLFP